MTGRSNGKGNGKLSLFAVEFVAVGFVIPIELEVPMEVSGYELEVRWVRVSTGQNTTWRAHIAHSDPAIHPVNHVFHITDTVLYPLQQHYGFRNVQYRARSLRGAYANASGVVEYGDWIESEWTELPGVTQRDLIWPRHESRLADILGDVRRLSGDRLGVIVSDDEVLKEMSEAIYDSWPTFGELWRYTFTMDSFTPNHWKLDTAIEQAVPMAVRVGNHTNWVFLTQYVYEYNTLSIPPHYGNVYNAVQFDVLVPPRKPTEINNATTSVARQYVTLETTKRVLAMIGERAGGNVMEAIMSLQGQIQMEIMRTGGGPSVDKQGYVHG